MEVNNANGLRRELHARGINPATTMVTPDNWLLLITLSGMTEIANQASAILHRRLTESEVQDLYNHLREIPAQRYANRTIADSIIGLAQDYIHQRAVTERDRRQGAAWEDHLTEYQKSEINQLTPSESTYKFRAFNDRRGNAVVDRDRATGKHSSPNDYPSLAPETIQHTAHEVMCALQQIVSPANWPETLQQMRDNYPRTFLDIQLARQTIQLDSRNAMPTYAAPGEFRWSLNRAGAPGVLGNVRIQDTLQQIMGMRINTLWIPLAQTSTAAAYGKIRLLIKEFTDQSITVTQYPNPAAQAVYLSNYHFDFDITEYAGGRAKLVPCLEGQFLFRAPFARLETVTLQFRSPFEILTFDPQFATMTLTYGNPTTLSVSPPATTAATTGNLVYILTSASGNSTLDAAITAASGYLLTTVTPQSFTIPLDTSTAIGSEVVQVYYAAKRIFLEIEFTCIEQ